MHLRLVCIVVYSSSALSIPGSHVYINIHMVRFEKFQTNFRTLVENQKHPFAPCRTDLTNDPY